MWCLTSSSTRVEATRAQATVPGFDEAFARLYGDRPAPRSRSLSAALARVKVLEEKAAGALSGLGARVALLPAAGMTMGATYALWAAGNGFRRGRDL